jgi:hypothetical protein
MMNFTACILHLILLRVIKSRRMRWVGHVACMGKGDVLTGFSWEARREDTTGKI